MHKETKENYLKAIARLSDKNGRVRNTDLAKSLSISKPTVTKALHQLEDDGCILLDKENGIMLTDSGKSIAVSTLERHLTFKTILTRLGVRDDVADRDACALEHCVSKESYKAFVKIKEIVTDSSASV